MSCLRRHTSDRARLPVTMPRKTDSDMCRERHSIASLQSDVGADEHGRLHGVSDFTRSFTASERRIVPRYLQWRRNGDGEPVDSPPQS
jgi:hypothetical protein